jgi:peptidoglycan/LPS O-acetylase OafA/YrhL
VAVLLVLLYHLKLHVLGHRLVSGGYFGVDVFFVLSGFLITTLLVEEWQRDGGVSLRAFYARRALRLFPALGVLLLAMLSYAWWLRVAHPSQHRASADLVRAVIATATYSANWVNALHLFNDGLAGLGTTWSLALEEQFYLLWPLALLLTLRVARTPRQALAVVMLGVLGATALRARLYVDGDPWYRIYFASDTRADSLLIGCALALVATAGLLPSGARARRLLVAASWVALGVLVALTTRLQDPNTLGRLQLVVYSLAGVGTAVVLARLLVAPLGPLGAALRVEPLRWIGRLSYGLYLWHLPIIVYLHLDPVPQELRPAVQVGVTFVVVMFSYYLVEQRCLRLKTRFSRAPGSAGRERALARGGGLP